MRRKILIVNVAMKNIIKIARISLKELTRFYLFADIKSNYIKSYFPTKVPFLPSFFLVFVLAFISSIFIIR